MRLAVAVAALALALTGCGASEPLPAAPGATFDPMAFFAGRTRGEATLDTLIDSPVRVTVESVGRVQGNTLVLDQAIRTGDKAPRMRRWTMWRVGANRFSGTLTDANGPVRGTTAGARAYIRYTMKGGFQVEQELALQGDGRSVVNRLQVKKFGVRVAILEETIRKSP
jgi:hypothetical protein